LKIFLIKLKLKTIKKEWFSQWQTDYLKLSEYHKKEKAFKTNQCKFRLKVKDERINFLNTQN
jgi:hypothetical protein